MKYESINRVHRNKMNDICKNSERMDWESPDFINYLMGKLPKVRRRQSDEVALEEIKLLEKQLSTYDVFLSDKESFINNVKNIVERIQAKIPYWYGLDLYELERIIKIQEFCLISGEGGIGKSYFIKCFEEMLENDGIPHLCIYGKFEKDADCIDVKEIINECSERFVFIVDAVNEMSEKGQNRVLNILKKLLNYPKIRIVITYRTGTMDADILKQYKNISKEEYVFSGVSFESALESLLKSSVPDVYMYENILYSNKPLLLNMLKSILPRITSNDTKRNGIASVTLIIEQYIINAVKDSFESIPCCGKDIWKDTKAIVRWMYENNTRLIPEPIFLSTVKTKEYYLSVMVQLGFITYYETNFDIFYQFTDESLMDYLIARSVFDDISKKSISEQSAIIKSKIECLPSIREAVVIALFDSCKSDYGKISTILEQSELDFDYEVIPKIHFTTDCAQSFINHFNIKDLDKAFVAIGGYSDKPLNCENFFFEYFILNKRNKELSKILCDRNSINRIKGRLKNAIYFITINDRPDRRDNEFFYFSLLCCASPNKDVRTMAMKLLYEIVKSDAYRMIVIEEYSRITEIYIKESIICALSQSSKDNKSIVEFFEKIVQEDDHLTAKSIKRIANYLGEEYGYIKWNRKNLFNYNPVAEISESLNNLLIQIDIMDKNCLPFRYRGKPKDKFFSKFLQNDKDDISKVNEYLESKYCCVRDGNCNGRYGFENVLKTEINRITKIVNLDNNSFFESYGIVLNEVFDSYKMSLEEANLYQRNSDYYIILKCVDIAIGLFYGSLMCNYYSNQFETYNGFQNCIGYTVYDPLEFDEEVSLPSPVPRFQNDIERFGEYLIDRIKSPADKSLLWAKDIELIRQNLLHLLEPISYQKGEWILLAARISVKDKNDKGFDTTQDNYNIWCCTSKNETIYDDGNARYLTIELTEYGESLFDYPLVEEKPWLCKRMKNIGNQSDAFDDTSLVLPPANIIKYFNLKYNIADSSWETPDNNKVLICNNNKTSYYTDPISSTVLIKKEFFDDFVNHNYLKYFAFSERFVPGNGFVDESSLHFEIINGEINKEIPNYGDNTPGEHDINPLCEECTHELNMGLTEAYEDISIIFNYGDHDIKDFSE